jgi:hypothetical protein
VSIAVTLIRPRPTASASGPAHRPQLSALAQYVLIVLIMLVWRSLAL